MPIRSKKRKQKIKLIFFQKGVAFLKNCVIIIWLTRRNCTTKYRGVEQLVARRAHNPKVVGSSPASATNNANRFRYRRKKPSNHNGYWAFFIPFFQVKLNRYLNPKTAFGEDLN